MKTKHLKPFDLQAALNGEAVMLRNGQKAYVRHHEMSAECEPWCKLLGYTERGLPAFWNERGKREDGINALNIIGMWPKTRIINGFEVPAPETKGLECGAYYLANTSATEFYTRYSWYNEEPDNRWLKRGLVFLTKEDAIANAKAMLGIDPYEESE